nr:hypothetical protein [uncultured Sediminibacterium sp.]
MSHPTIDPRWGHDEPTFPYDVFYKTLVPDLYLKDEVPEDVKGQWKVIKSLIELSYYQTEFMDLAVHKALLSLEMAMKFRHKEITQSDKGLNLTMKPLLYWFYSRGYFEADHEEYIKHIEFMRNHYSHPKLHSFGGHFIVHNIYHPLSMINDLYEDTELRKERDKVWKQLLPITEQINQYGGLVKWEDGTTDIIYYVELEFVNNKKNPAEIYLSYRQVFDIPTEYKRGDSCCVYPTQPVSFYNMELGDLELKATSLDTCKKFYIAPLAIENQRDSFTAWKNLYNDYAIATGHHLAIQSRLNSRWLSLLYQFYQQ